MDEIADNYHLSETGLAKVFAEMDELNKRQGLGTDFNGAPRQVIVDFVGYLTEHYGSITEYLNSIGFTGEYQQRVARLSI